MREASESEFVRALRYARSEEYPFHKDLVFYYESRRQENRLLKLVNTSLTISTLTGEQKTVVPCLSVRHALSSFNTPTNKLLEKLRNYNGPLAEMFNGKASVNLASPKPKLLRGIIAYPQNENGQQKAQTDKNTEFRARL